MSSAATLGVEEHLVAEAGAATRAHSDAQAQLGLALGLDELLTFAVAVSVGNDQCWPSGTGVDFARSGYPTGP